MNVQEKMTMLKCYAYQKRESQGMEGKEAGMLEDWIDEEALAGEVTPEEIDQACRLSEYEIMYFGEKRFTIFPEEQEDILQWLRDLTQSSKLAEETKESIRETHRLLAAEWGKSA